MRILSVGEILWDVIGDNEYLGGAPLNFSVSAARLQHSVALLSGVGQDARGRRALEFLLSAGIDTTLIQVRPDRATGTALVTIGETGHASFEIPRPAAFDQLSPTQLQAEYPDWIYYGTLFNSLSENLGLSCQLGRQFAHARRFYDVNLRTGHWHVAAVESLAREAHVTKLNDLEVGMLALDLWAEDQMGEEEFCRRWQSEFGCDVICITRAERGCAIFRGGVFTEIPGFAIQVADTVGAGDAFAAAFLHGFDQGWPTREIGRLANAAGAVVASRRGATPPWSLEDCTRLFTETKVAAG